MKIKKILKKDLKILKFKLLKNIILLKKIFKLSKIEFINLNIY